MHPGTQKSVRTPNHVFKEVILPTRIWIDPSQLVEAERYKEGQQSGHDPHDEGSAHGSTVDHERYGRNENSGSDYDPDHYGRGIGQCDLPPQLDLLGHHSGDWNPDFWWQNTEQSVEKSGFWRSKYCFWSGDRCQFSGVQIWRGKSRLGKPELWCWRQESGFRRQRSKSKVINLDYGDRSPVSEDRIRILHTGIRFLETGVWALDIEDRFLGSQKWSKVCARV